MEIEMYLEMVLGSRPDIAGEQQEERERLEIEGFTVKKSPPARRYRAYRSIESVALLAHFNDFELFGDVPKLFGVRFSDVACASICGVPIGAWRGGFEKVIMVEPQNVHSDLFSFTLHFDTYRNSVTVEVMCNYMTDEGAADLIELLEICEREFGTPGKRVSFHSRKYIKRARRRYLFWLAREGKLPESLKGDYDRAAMSFNQNQIGLLRGADTVWEQIVKTERALRST